MTTAPQIILASISPYRKHLLSRLRIPFICASPQTDETPVIGEPAEARALRLAEEKACSLSAQYPSTLILGGDQTIACGNDYFDKPLTTENAVAQLLIMRGKSLSFYTALALKNTITGSCQSRLTTHTVRLRNISDDEISNYVQKEPALNCAGGAQIEGLGIALMEDIQGGDPTALMGMSLIDVTFLLQKNGIAIL